MAVYDNFVTFEIISVILRERGVGGRCAGGGGGGRRAVLAALQLSFISILCDLKVNTKYT